MQTIRIRSLLLIGIAALCAAVPASAELYKWVDERGVTNYSNERPPAGANKVARVDNTISVYTPDESFMQSVKAMRERGLRAMSEPEPARSPVGVVSTAQSGYEKCVLSGRLGCEDIYGASQWHTPAIAIIPYHRFQPTRFTYQRPPSPPAARESRIATQR